MRGGKAKTKRTRTKKVARSTMGSLMSPVDVTSTNMLSALDKRIKSGPLTLVLVYADWCGHCQRFKPMMKELEKLNNRSIQMARVRDDVYPQTTLAAKNKVEGYPSLLLVDSAGNAMNFKQPSGEISNAVPEHTNMTKMTALVRTAGTPEGMNLLSGLNKNLTAKKLPSGVTEQTNTINSLKTVNTNVVNAVNSINKINNSVPTNGNRNANINTNTNANNTNIQSTMELEEDDSENKVSPDSAVSLNSNSVQTVTPLTNSSIATNYSLAPNSGPKNIVADRMSANNVASQNATLNTSKNKVVRNLTQKGGSVSGIGSESFCGSSCSIPHSQSGGGGLLSALSAAASNLAPAASLFLAAEAVAGRKRGRKGKSRKQRGGGCGCGLTRKNYRG